MSSRVRRARYLYLQFASDEVLDLGALLGGRAELSAAERVVAMSALTGREWTITPDELELLRAIPGDRFVEADADDEAVDRLARRGLLVSESDDPELAELRRREQRLAEDGWHPYPALLHFVGKWRDVEAGGDTAIWQQDAEAYADRYDRLVERQGAPPAHFHRRGGERLELPLVPAGGDLHAALERRRTTRVFSGEPVALDQLAHLLYEVFGCHGTAEVAEGVTLLAKTSPSGGARHSLEAYPLLLDVEGVDPGLYHYDVGDHALEVLRRLDREDAARLAVLFAADQAWIAGAAAVVVVTSRFGRMLWKYRHNNRAYLTLFVEAGHFSQSFYLVAGELGLGAFVSAAVNGGNIEDELGLDPVEEGAIALCGCGVPLPGSHPLQPEFRPYRPRS